VTSILTNHEAERLLLDIRIGRAAGGAHVGGVEGALLGFPTSVVVAVPGRGYNVFPLRTSAEPGTVCSSGGWSSVTGKVDGAVVEGQFEWVLDSTVADASYQFRRDGLALARPHWADQLPRSQRLSPVGPQSLTRQQGRLVRRGRAAESELLHRTAMVFEHVCRGPLRRAIAMRPTLDVADVVQRGMQVAARLLPLYSSAARPPCSWIGMIQLDGRRDLHRAVTQLDWLPRDLSEVLARVEAPVEPGDDPTVVLAAIIEAAVTHHQPVPRATLGQIEAALSAPQVVPLDIAAANAVPGAGHHLLGEADPDLTAADDRPGHLTAEIGRLIGAHPSLVARASLGDHQAIHRIGQGVIAALRQPGETDAGTRQRCRQELRVAGRLFTSPDALASFGLHVPARQLAELDASLAELVGRIAS
jgi:hypothetical protein